MFKIVVFPAPLGPTLIYGEIYIFSSRYFNAACVIVFAYVFKNYIVFHLSPYLAAPYYIYV
jgi:hypothetical protein